MSIALPVPGRRQAEAGKMEAEARSRVPSRLMFKSTFGIAVASLIVFEAIAPTLGIASNVVVSGSVAAVGGLLGAILGLRAR